MGWGAWRRCARDLEVAKGQLLQRSDVLVLAPCVRCAAHEALRTLKEAQATGCFAACQARVADRTQTVRRSGGLAGRLARDVRSSRVGLTGHSSGCLRLASEARSGGGWCAGGCAPSRARRLPISREPPRSNRFLAITQTIWWPFSTTKARHVLVWVHAPRHSVELRAEPLRGGNEVRRSEKNRVGPGHHETGVNLGSCAVRRRSLQRWEVTAGDDYPLWQISNVVLYNYNTTSVKCA